MADLTTPIDITAIQDTANKIRPEIKSLMMQNIQTVLAKLAIQGGIQHDRDLLTFIDGTVGMPYDSLLQNWNKLGEIVKRTVEVKVGMVPIKDEVERYRKSYMVTLDDLNLTEKKLPFAEWYLRTYVGVGLKSLHTLPYQGVYNAAGTTPNAICNGYFKIIEDEKTATNISVVKGNMYEVGAADYTVSNIFEKLKAQYDLFPDVTKEYAEVEIRIPYRYRAIYREWYKTEYSTLSPKEIDLDYLDGTDGKAKFLWESAMGTEKKVIMNVPGNLMYGVDRDNQEFGKPTIFHWNGNPLWIAMLNKIVIGFQIYSLDSRVFNVNNL